MNQLTKEEKIKSINAVKDAISYAGSFSTKCSVDVIKNGNLLYSYKDIDINMKEGKSEYGQFDVGIYWNDDITHPKKYKSRGLYGEYNTNFQPMEYRDKTLIITSDNLTIHIKL